MKKYGLSLLAVFFSLQGFSGEFNIESYSQVRDPNKSYKAYYVHPYGYTISDEHEQYSAYDIADSYSRTDLSRVTRWDSFADLFKMFRFIRDKKFLNDEDHKMMRRSTWLYPDDGCFARAALMKQNISKEGIAPPTKVFIFGDLDVATKNSPWGEVHWWYHVAPVVHVEGFYFVLDPALEPNRPLFLDEWIAKMIPSEVRRQTPDDPLGSVKISICDPASYIPYSICSNPPKSSDSDALEDQYRYLDREWNRLEELKRNPNVELGDVPPWAEKQKLQREQKTQTQDYYL
ncbi:MAG: protein-glutamine glutaminase family protein [Bacteriovoracia bacterium]